jgi:hypothetical protein
MSKIGNRLVKYGRSLRKRKKRIKAYLLFEVALYNDGAAACRQALIIRGS